MVYTLEKLTIKPLISLWLRKVEGIGNIPKGIPFILAPNHSSYLDVFLAPSIVLSSIGRKMHALGNYYYWKNSFTSFFLDWWECIPVYVEHEKNAKEKNMLALEKALSYLKQGHIFIIFPEGRRSDGKLIKGHTGIARLALMAKVPVLPCGIINANNVLPKGKLFPRFARCEVKIGKLMYFDKYYNKKPSKKILEEITRSIKKEIAKLIGQKYNY